MSTESADAQQKKVRDFMTLLPLTLEVAGLPHSEPHKHFNEDQMQARANTIKAAYKVARQLLVDIVR